MAEITFEAVSQKGETFRAATLADAIEGFLAKSKARTFSVSELRDGAFVAVLFSANGQQSCYYKKFKSRDEARAYLGTLRAHA